MKVFLDAGHGGYDAGAIGPNGLRESDVNLDVAMRIGEYLRSRDVEVDYSRTSDVFVPLERRAQLANLWGADYFISIHCNSFSNPSANGTEIYCLVPGGERQELAQSIQDSMVAATGLRDRGVNFANFVVLRLTYMPALLDELAFISNPHESELLAQSSFRDTCARAVSNGLLGYIGYPAV